MSEKIEITKTGWEELQKEYRELIDVKRPEYKEQLQEARGQGDLSENADYDAARELQANVEARITEVENILHHCIVVDDTVAAKTVRVGSKVVIKDLRNNSEHTYIITSSTEAKPLEGKISKECPLGIALLHKKAKDIVTVKTRTEYQVELLSIEAAK